MTLSQKEQNAESRVDAIATTPEKDHTNIEGPENNNPLVFPAGSLIGSIGELAAVLSEGTEVPAEFIFVAGLTALGSLCSRDLKFDIGCNVQPRLYTLLLGNSADVKKSTALGKTLDFFKGMAYKMDTTPVPTGNSELLEIMEFTRLAATLFQWVSCQLSWPLFGLPSAPASHWNWRTSPSATSSTS